MKRWQQWGFGASAILALLAVFALYTQPTFVVDLANRLWACF